MLRLWSFRDQKGMLEFRRVSRFLTRNLLLVTVVALTAVPVYYAAFHATRSNIVQESYSSFRTGFSRVDGMLQNLADLSDTINAEPSVEHLAQIKGDMSMPDYAYLLNAQNFLSQTLVSDSLVKNAYCLFPGNRIFLSRTLTSPDWSTIYGTFLSIDGVSGDDWYQHIVDSQDRINFPYQKRSNWLFSPSTVNTMQDTVQLAILPVRPGRLQPDCVLVYILDTGRLFGCFGSEEMVGNSFFYISDAAGTPVVRKNYTGKGLNLEQNIQQVKIGRARYTVMQARSEISGIRFVMGVPESYFAQKMQPLSRIILIYIMLFCAVALTASLLLAVRQYSPLRKLMQGLKDVISEPVDAKAQRNEYGYIMDAVRSLDDKNRRYETELTFLSASLYNNMLDRLLSGKIQTQQDEENCSTMFGFSSRWFCACAVRFGDAAVKLAGMDETLRVNALIKDEIARQLACPAYFYNAEFHSGYVLFNLPEEYRNDRERLVRCMEQAVHSVRETLNAAMVCGIGSVCEGIRQIYTSAGQARDALWLSNEHIPVRIWTEQREPGGGMLMDSKFARRLEEILSVGDSQYVDDCFARLDRRLESSQSLSEPQICQAFYTMRNTLESAAQKLGSGFSVKLPAYSRRLGARELFRLFYKPGIAICRYVQECHEKKDDSQRREILDFIRQNYADCNLCAQTIASHFFVSEKYVFTIVKGMTDQSLGEYLEHLRFARVEELLRSEVEISEIPQQVGYRFVNTFYKSFKRRYGVSPGKWREQMRRSDGAALPD